MTYTIPVLRMLFWTLFSKYLHGQPLAICKMPSQPFQQLTDHYTTCKQKQDLQVTHTIPVFRMLFWTLFSKYLRGQPLAICKMPSQPFQQLTDHYTTCKQKQDLQVTHTIPVFRMLFWTFFSKYLRGQPLAICKMPSQPFQQLTDHYTTCKQKQDSQVTHTIPVLRMLFWTFFSKYLRGQPLTICKMPSQPF